MPYGYSENECGCGGPLTALTLVDPACPENTGRTVTFDVLSGCCSAEIAVGESLYDGLRLPMLVDSIAIKPQCCGCGSTLTIAPPCDCSQFATVTRGDPCGMAGMAMTMPLRLACDGCDPCGFCSTFDISITPQDHSCADQMWVEFGGTYYRDGSCTPLPVHFLPQVTFEECTTFYQCAEFQSGVNFECCMSVCGCADFYGVVNFRAGDACVEIGCCGILVGCCVHIGSTSLDIGCGAVSLGLSGLSLCESCGCASRCGQVRFYEGDLWVSVHNGEGNYLWKRITREA